MYICKFFCLILVNSNMFQAFDHVVALMLKFCSYNIMLNEAPNNNVVTRIANIVLNEVPNSNDATRIGNNVRLTAMGTQQFSMAVIQPSCRKAYLPETIDNDTITRKVCADGNKFCPGKEWTLYTQQFRWQVDQCGQAVKRNFLQFDNFSSVNSKAV